MGIQPPPLFAGIITVGSSNNTIDFEETDGFTTDTSTATISTSPGTYYIDATVSTDSILQTIADEMTTASAYGATYTCTMDLTSPNEGVITIAASGGSLTGFYLKLTAAESNKLLTGGDAAVGEQGLNHLGWYTQSVYPSFDLTTDNNTQPSNTWIPTGPVPNSTVIAALDRSFSWKASQQTTLGGRTVTRSWSESYTSTDINPNEVIILTCEFLTDSDRDNWQRYFVGPYAHTGARFRFHRRRSDLTIWDDVHLTQETIEQFAPDRLPGYPYFNTTINMKRWKS